MVQGEGEKISEVQLPLTPLLHSLMDLLRLCYHLRSVYTERKRGLAAFAKECLT